MTVYACPYEHPDGYLVWGDPVETIETLTDLAIDPARKVVTRLLPWVVYGLAPTEFVRFVVYGKGEMTTTDRYGPAIAYYTALGDKERLRVALDLRG